MFLSLILSMSGLNAQSSPSGISYQAIARDANGTELANQNLTVRIAIIGQSINGVVEFEELHNVTTNLLGLFTLVIGQGVPSGNGTYSTLIQLPWAAHDHFIRVDVDTPSSTGFITIGTSQLLSVPYAFHAATADSANEVDGDPENELISSALLDGTDLKITEGDSLWSVDLSSLQSVDNSITNEVIVASVVTPTQITLQEGASSYSIDVSNIAYATWSKSGSNVYNLGNEVGVNTATPTSTLHINGSMATAVTAVNGNSGGTSLTLTGDHHTLICDVSNGPITLTLPIAANAAGRNYVVRKIFSQTNNTNDVLLLAAAGEQIEFDSTFTLGSPNAEYLGIVSDGTKWIVIYHQIAP